MSGPIRVFGPGKNLTDGHILREEGGYWDALDHLCYSHDSMVVRPNQRLCDWGIHSHPSGNRYRRGADQNHSGAQAILIFSPCRRRDRIPEGPSPSSKSF